MAGIRDGALPTTPGYITGGYEMVLFPGYGEYSSFSGLDVMETLLAFPGYVGYCSQSRLHHGRWSLVHHVMVVQASSGDGGPGYIT